MADLPPETLAQQVDALIERLLSIANSSDGGLQLYSGTASHDRAFDIVDSDPDGKPRVIQYLGSSLRSQVLVAPNTPIDTLYSGEEVFQQTDREPSVFSGNTGTTVGFGTDSATGQGELLVSHTLTTYGGAAGVSPGASSATGDTIIGAHTLTIADDPSLGRVVRLNNGQPVPFNALSVDLEVSAPNGESVFVDLSAVPAVFTGGVPITADGTISVDGGVSAVPISFSANQTLTHAVTSEVTNVDSVNIRRTGTEGIEYVGTLDAFEVLIQLRDELRNSQSITSTELDAIMQHRIKDLERVQHQILAVVGEQSVTLENLDALESRAQDVQLDTRLAIGDMENADMAEVILELQNEQLILQFVYASAANIFNTSLLDFIS